jgi:hypothetical protein
LGGADFLTALVSQEAALSPMVVDEIERAHRLNVAHKRPGISRESGTDRRIRLASHLRCSMPSAAGRFG